MHSNGCVNNEHTVPYIEIATVFLTLHGSVFALNTFFPFQLYLFLLLKQK